MRAKRALESALQGHCWETVAADAGYPNRGSAFKAVQRELQRTLRPIAEEYRTLECLRLDALLEVYYAKALGGDGWSMDRCLRIMERRATLLGLDVRPESANGQAQGQMVVIGVPQAVLEAV